MSGVRTAQSYISELTESCPPANWFQVFTLDLRRGDSLAVKDVEDAVYLFVWVLGHLDECIPHLEHEATHFARMRDKLLLHLKAEERKDLSMCVILRDITGTQESTREYNELARLCSDISNALASPSMLGMNDDAYNLFYMFGQTCNMHNGGVITKYIDFKEGLKKLIWKYT